MNYQGWAEEGSGDASLSVGAPLGNLGRGSVYRELQEIVEEGLRKWNISLWELC